jgi:adenylate cyclase, class 2
MLSGAIEIEAKFYVGRLRSLEERVVQRGGRLHSARILETNLRFDTADEQLRRGNRALRLRRDSTVTLTYKGPGAMRDGIRRRPESEVQVADLERARAVLEGLGYVVVFEYEKYRTTYSLGDVEIMLDELPYGDFVELEGGSDLLKPAALQLGLRWETAIPHSYHSLFEQLRAARSLLFRDLTFENFARVTARIDDLHLAQADN